MANFEKFTIEVTKLNGVNDESTHNLRLIAGSSINVNEKFNLLNQDSKEIADILLGGDKVKELYIFLKELNKPIDIEKLKQIAEQVKTEVNKVGTETGIEAGEVNEDNDVQQAKNAVLEEIETVKNQSVGVDEAVDAAAVAELNDQEAVKTAKENLIKKLQELINTIVNKKKIMGGYNKKSNKKNKITNKKRKESKKKIYRGKSLRKKM